jgi:alkyldihydroxyacetonephosphate synthase
VIEDLRSLLGAERVLTEPDVLVSRARDSWPLQLVRAAIGVEPAYLPLCVVRPVSTEDVAAVLRFASVEAVSVVPYGGGSGVLGGTAPPTASIVLELGSLDRILELDEQNLSVRVQAGVVLGSLEAWLNERGYTTGHYPQSIGTAQVGGLIATRSAGQFSTRYGNIEDVILGLEAVLPDGSVVSASNEPRRSSGPDLRHLFIGCEGTLGVVTAATLRVFPRPASRHIAAYAIPSMREGLQLLRDVMREGWRPAVARLHDSVEAARSYGAAVQAGECILLVLSEGPAGYAELESAAVSQHVAGIDGARPLGPDPVVAWLEHRNDVREFYRYVARGVLVDTIDVAARWSVVPDLYDAALADLRASVPEMIVASAHASHCYAQGTSLYFIVAAQPPRNAESVERVYWSIWTSLMRVTQAYGGTISHHHGIGKARARWLPSELGSAYPLLRRIKQALDPTGIMNPGTLLPADGQQP